MEMYSVSQRRLREDCFLRRRAYMAEQWIRRLGSKASGFRYARPDGKPVRDARTLARIDKQRVPPAWRDVHLAVNARRSIQAWGYDVRGRKQYRYNERAVE